MTDGVDAEQGSLVRREYVIVLSPLQLAQALLAYCAVQGLVPGGSWRVSCVPAEFDVVGGDGTTLRLHREGDHAVKVREILGLLLVPFAGAERGVAESERRPARLTDSQIQETLIGMTLMLTREKEISAEHARERQRLLEERRKIGFAWRLYKDTVFGLEEVGLEQILDQIAKETET